MNENNLSDPGIAAELTQEAVADAKAAAQRAADTVSTAGSQLGKNISTTAHAAYEDPVNFAEYAGRSFVRFARRRPLDAVFVAASVAFVFGALTQLGRR
jgi:ElaB/YqjD/DUF883 family membrane-anchored ribosome-binding protein